MPAERAEQPVDSHGELPLDPDPAATGPGSTGPGWTSRGSTGAGSTGAGSVGAGSVGAGSTGAGSTGAGSVGTGPAGRPVHLQPLPLALVVAGGMLGTPARYAVGLALPTRSGSWPAGTLLCNLLGALLLGVLLEGLLRAGTDTGRRRLVRLAAGTGFLGSFTTYSTLAVETDLLVRSHRPGLAVGYAAVTLLAGLVLSAAGIGLAAARQRRRHPPGQAMDRLAVDGLPVDPDGGTAGPSRRPA